MYRIEYYWPLGGDGVDEARPLLNGKEFETVESARGAIQAETGGDFGQWEDDDGNECWHESSNDGCGGWCIVQA